MQSIFLIDRGEQVGQVPEPFKRRVLVSDSSRVARRLAGDTADGRSVWQNLGRHNKDRGLLLIRWKGLDLDYGTALRPSLLPDGTPAGFHHRDNRATWGLFSGAVWWSSGLMPQWLARLGVYCPEFTEAPGLIEEVMNDEAAAVAAQTGNRPFGFRALPDWRALAKSPGFRDAWLPGIEHAQV